MIAPSFLGHQLAGRAVLTIVEGKVVYDLDGSSTASTRAHSRGCSGSRGDARAHGHEASAAMWARHNGCGTTTHRLSIQGGHCDVYDNCPVDGQVELCSFDAMGHCWPGGVQGTFGCPTYASATRLEWDFFKQYAW